MWRRQLGHMRESDDHSSRSAGCSCGRRRFRVSTSMWCRSAMFSSASSRRSRATALTAASAYLKTSHIDASRHAGSVDCPLDHVKQNADPLMALHRSEPVSWDGKT